MDRRSDDPDTERQWRVLLAEDDEDLRSLLVQALRDEGFAVVECPNGLALVEQVVSQFDAFEQGFDLVISDVRMPGVSGLSVLEGISEWDDLPRVPMVLITAFSEPRVHDLARRFGAISVLEKPFEMSALLQIVRSALGD